MEEDIKILEKLSSIYQELQKDFEEGHASSYEMQFKDFTAIESLLKRYKELEKHISFYEKNNSYKERIIELKEENALLKHRLEVANEFIESRQEVLIPENYEDLKYILNECDLESTW